MSRDKPTSTLVNIGMDGQNGALARIGSSTRAFVRLNAEVSGIDPGLIMSAMLSGLCSLAADDGQRTREGWASILEEWAREIRAGEKLPHQRRDDIGAPAGNA